MMMQILNAMTGNVNLKFRFALQSNLYITVIFGTTKIWS